MWILLSLETFLQCLLDGLNGPFSITVALVVFRTAEGVLNFPFFTELFVFFASILRSSVGDDFFGYTIS